jgi:hypothetical protein
MPVKRWEIEVKNIYPVASIPSGLFTLYYIFSMDVLRGIR